MTPKLQQLCDRLLKYRYTYDGKDLADAIEALAEMIESKAYNEEEAVIQALAGGDSTSPPTIKDMRRWDEVNHAEHTYDLSQDEVRQIINMADDHAALREAAQAAYELFAEMDMTERPAVAALKAALEKV